MSAIDIDRFVQNIFAMPSTLSPSSELERGFAKPRKKSNFGFINSRKVITRGEATSPKAVYQVPVPLLALTELTLIDNDEIKLAVEGVKHHDSVRSEEFVVVNTPKTGSSSGTIKQIRGGKFGFISDNTCPSYDLFFHMSEVAADTIDQLKPGSHISYTVEVDQFRTDRFKAVAIHAIKQKCSKQKTSSNGAKQLSRPDRRSFRRHVPSKTIQQKPTVQSNRPDRPHKARASGKPRSVYVSAKEPQAKERKRNSSQKQSKAN